MKYSCTTYLTFMTLYDNVTGDVVKPCDEDTNMSGEECNFKTYRTLVSRYNVRQ